MTPLISKIATQICCGTYEGATEDSESTSDESSLGDPEKAPAIVEWLEETEGSPSTIADWLEETEGSRGVAPEDTANDDDGEEQVISGHKMLLESEAYRWLISMMQRTVRLNAVNPDCMVGHRENITRQLQSITTQEAQKRRIKRLITSKRPPPLYIARFEISWDLLKFLREEYEGETLAEVVGQVVTLTGDGHSVQAETCRGYIEQTWTTSGSEFVDLIEDMITRTGQSCTRMSLVPYSDNTSAWLNVT